LDSIAANRVAVAIIEVQSSVCLQAKRYWHVAMSQLVLPGA
jgi:hypothetical protein